MFGDPPVTTDPYSKVNDKWTHTERNFGPYMCTKYLFQGQKIFGSFETSGSVYDTWVFYGFFTRTLT